MVGIVEAGALALVVFMMVEEVAAVGFCVSGIGGLLLWFVIVIVVVVVVVVVIVFVLWLCL